MIILNRMCRLSVYVVRLFSMSLTSVISTLFSRLLVGLLSPLRSDLLLSVFNFVCLCVRVSVCHQKQKKPFLLFRILIELGHSRPDDTSLGSTERWSSIDLAP